MYLDWHMLLWVSGPRLCRWKTHWRFESSHDDISSAFLLYTNRYKLEGLLSLYLLVVLPWICSGWCCLVCPLDTDIMNLWNKDKNHGIRQHGTLMQGMTFSCHLIFQHFAAVQSQNNFEVSILASVNLPFAPNPFTFFFSLRSLQLLLLLSI